MSRFVFVLILSAAALGIVGCNGSSKIQGPLSISSSSASSSGCGLTSTCQVTLSWIAPTTNSDGSSLTNLAGYKVHYGISSPSQVIDVKNVTTYSLAGLGTGTYYFSVSSYNASGVESSPSAQVSKSF